jgi:hypothetical protein
MAAMNRFEMEHLVFKSKTSEGLLVLLPSYDPDAVSVVQSEGFSSHYECQQERRTYPDHDEPL